MEAIRQRGGLDLYWRLGDGGRGQANIPGGPARVGGLEGGRQEVGRRELQNIMNVRPPATNGVILSRRNSMQWWKRERPPPTRAKENVTNKDSSQMRGRIAIFSSHSRGRGGRSQEIPTGRPRPKQGFLKKGGDRRGEKCESSGTQTRSLLSGERGKIAYGEVCSGRLRSLVTNQGGK